MASVNLASDEVFVFPSANREYNYRGARYSSETNLTGIVKSGVNNSSYVLDDTGNNIRFVIEGYYFEADKQVLQGKFTSSTDIYAYINITIPSDTQGIGKYLYGTDLNGDYLGVSFVDDLNGVVTESGCTSHYLHLYARTATEDIFSIPQISLQMYNLSHAYGIVPEVDGGSIGANGSIS